MGERKNETLGANLVVVMRMSRCDTGDLPAKFLLDSGVIGLSGGEIARREVLAKLLKFRLEVLVSRWIGSWSGVWKQIVKHGVAENTDHGHCRFLQKTNARLSQESGVPLVFRLQHQPAAEERFGDWKTH